MHPNVKPNYECSKCQKSFFFDFQQKYHRCSAGE
ncbi:unnamed protein product [Enterobius vermicularis]|uniref:C2H2-type domain-containing protein n=1 Tax=Enterobius vermicularis TaxID=51028 RepID=A0A0N4VRC4_ENTVE|nr:unnamed protein product [Enterobius vermicularis]